MKSPSIFTFVKEEEARFQTDEIQIGDNWNWNFRNHVQLLFHLKNGIFFSGSNDWKTQLRAFKNIMEPILNLSYWAEDIEMKDIVFFIEKTNGRVLSFLIKKYHDEVYVRENNLDTFLDELTESDLDYGGALVQKGKNGVPEVKQLNEVAFCDQSDIMGGPLALKFNFAPDALRAMSSRGWGKESNGATHSIEELCVLAENEKETVGTMTGQKNKTPGKSIEVYVVKGALPDHYLNDNNDMEYYCEQLHVLAFYTDKDNKQQGVTLYRKEGSGNLKFHTSKKVFGRALGRGVGEGLLHPQIWTNFLTIHKTAMLEAASKILPYTDDVTFTNKNQLKDIDNLEMTVIAEGKTIGIVPNAAVPNIQLYEKSINEWYENAQAVGSAFDPILGKEDVSGTTFRGKALAVQQGRGLHDRRRGQRAKFIEECYREWMIPAMVKEIVNGKEFLATLTADEMEWVAESLAQNHVNRRMVDMMIAGKLPTEEEKQMLKDTFLKDFFKGGNRKLLKVLKDEFRDIEVKIGINVANKQKDLVNATDKLVSIFQFAFSNPQGFQQIMQLPGMSTAFNDILEYSGLSEVNFAALTRMQLAPETPQPAPQGTPSPLQLNPPVEAA